MNLPSRTMPAAPIHKMRWWGWLILAAMLSGLAFWMCRQPYLIPFAIVIGVLVRVQARSEARRRKLMSESRYTEAICDFARSFDRQTDTWIIRAVYEEMSRFLAVDGHPLPVRRDDRWKEDLKIDYEDLDDLLRDIAYRARRSIDDSDKNPVYGKVLTVGDVVTFFQHQPRLEDVEQGAAGNSHRA